MNQEVKSKCHCPGCNKPSRFECTACQKVGFAPLSVCSSECFEKLKLNHTRNWHESEQGERALEPVPLVEVRNQEQDVASLLLVPRGRRVLQELCQEAKNEPVRVLVVVGGSRTGKSSRLNWLLSQLGIKGTFQIGAGSKPVTSGLWLWPSLLEYKGGRFLLLDCEGTQRGRDSVTMTLSSLAAELASCLIINIKGGLSNSVIHLSQRLHHAISSSQGKRHLVWWCNDVSPEWKTQTGDLKVYVQEQLQTCQPTIQDKFHICLETCPMPSDEDLEQLLLNPQLIQTRKTPFCLDVKRILGHVLAQLRKIPIVYYNNQEPQGQGNLCHILESTLHKYVKDKSGAFLPSLIVQIHKQEAERELHETCAEYQTKYIEYSQTLIPYFPPSYNMKSATKRKRDEFIQGFCQRCQALQLAEAIRQEYTNQLTQRLDAAAIPLQLNWETRLDKLLIQQQEEEKRKRQAELKKQESARIAAQQQLQQLQEQQRRLQEQQQYTVIQKNGVCLRIAKGSKIVLNGVEYCG